MRAWASIAILLYVAGLVPAVADASKPTAPPPKEQLTLEKFGDANKSCLQWSDGCAVCKRAADDSFACSVTGISCQPVEVACRQSAPDPKPEARPEPPKK